jgi:hypothetical protein
MVKAEAEPKAVTVENMLPILAVYSSGCLCYYGIAKLREEV